MPRQPIGALPSQEIRKLITAGFITGANPENVSPASLDLSLTEVLYEIRGAVLPKQGEDIESMLRRIDPRKHDMENPLEAGKIYIAKLAESVDLPKDIRGYCNPKSSTGRIDVHARVLADGVQRYDSLIPPGYTGSLWILIAPKSFGVKVAPGITLSQLRLFMGDTRFTPYDLEMVMREHQLVWDTTHGTPIPYEKLLPSGSDGTILLTALIPEDGIAGYRCIAEPDRVLDMTKKKHYEPRDFFVPVYIGDKRELHLRRDTFYILSGAEAIRIPPGFASEMISMDMRSGDFRSHYAGFLDPGWGYGKTGEGRGRPFTLEVRPFETLTVLPGQPIATIQFERLMAEPDMVYDNRGSNYTEQRAAQLSKHFKPWID